MSLNNFSRTRKKLCEITEQGYFDKGLDTFWELISHYGTVRSLLDFDVFRTMDQGCQAIYQRP